jgi:hypothetical protein
MILRAGIGPRLIGIECAATVRGLRCGFATPYSPRLRQPMMGFVGARLAGRAGR